MRLMLTSASRRLSWSRWLVLALMALCLPLQGALAVTMQVGMMGMVHGGTAAAAITSGHGAHSDHSAHGAHGAASDHSGPALHSDHCGPTDHTDHTDRSSHCTPTGDPTTATPNDTPGDTHHGCSFCAQCCIGVALLATPLTVAASPLAATPPAATPGALLEHQPQTPDRPPKPALA